MNACWRRCRTMVAEFVSLLLRVDIVIRTRDGPKTIYSPMFYIPYLVLIVILARNIINSGSSDWLSEQFFVRFQVSYRAISTTMKSLIKRMRYPTPTPAQARLQMMSRVATDWLRLRCWPDVKRAVRILPWNEYHYDSSPACMYMLCAWGEAQAIYFNRHLRWPRTPIIA